MTDVIVELTPLVSDEDGHVYTARVLGEQRLDGGWVGRIEFRPRGGRGLARVTATETTQPSLDALRYWASGLEPVYLDGALERAFGRRARAADSS